MKVNELINSFEIFITNEERSIYENMNERAALVQFNEREQFIIQNLIRKSLVSKVISNGQVLVVKNDQQI
jgi:hypothetical protein